ncbi:hemin receptor [Gammaproteobacteria bacterium 45_16_T64]|nr:hemin receptor [Gammaproteobacteria bacterium 45_16_T64]
MSLTAHQIRIVQESFTKVEPIAEKAADIFYTTLFEYDPTLRPLFKANLKDQGKKLMSTLKVAVNGLNDLDKLVPVLQGLAERHVKYGVKAKDFTPVGNALLHTLKTGLGPAFTPELREAWVTVIHIVANTMKAHSFS